MTPCDPLRYLDIDQFNCFYTNSTNHGEYRTFFAATREIPRQNKLHENNPLPPCFIDLDLHLFHVPIPVSDSKSD